jgi:hypothetical protein
MSTNEKLTANATIAVIKDWVNMSLMRKNGGNRGLGNPAGIGPTTLTLNFPDKFVK